MPPLTSSSVIERAKLGHPEDSTLERVEHCEKYMYSMAAYNGVIKCIHTYTHTQKVFRWKIKSNKRKLVRKEINNFVLRILNLETFCVHELNLMNLKEELL